MASHENRKIRRAVERALRGAGAKGSRQEGGAIIPGNQAGMSFGSRVSGTVLGLITVASLILVLWPRLTVTISDPVDPDDPFSSSVTVTNTGYIPLESVIQSVGVGQIGGINTVEDKSFIPEYTEVRRAQWQPQNLGLDQKFTFALNDMVDMKTADMGYADIAIWVEYELPGLPFKLKKPPFPYVARRQTNGHFYWYPQTKR
jgi:hypothetical protein